MHAGESCIAATAAPGGLALAHRSAHLCPTHLSLQQERPQYLYHFVLHAALDAVEEQEWRTSSMHLGVVDRFNQLQVSAFTTAAHAKFLLLHDGRSDDLVRSFFKDVYELYLRVSGGEGWQGFDTRWPVQARGRMRRRHWRRLRPLRPLRLSPDHAQPLPHTHHQDHGAAVPPKGAPAGTQLLPLTPSSRSWPPARQASASAERGSHRLAASPPRFVAVPFSL